MEKLRFVKGLKGLSELLGVSVDNAHLLVKSGRLDKSIIMIGKKRMLFEADKVFELLTLDNLKKSEADGK